MGRKAWQPTVPGAAKESDMTEGHVWMLYHGCVLFISWVTFITRILSHQKCFPPTYKKDVAANRREVSLPSVGPAKGQSPGAFQPEYHQPFHLPCINWSLIFLHRYFKNTWLFTIQLIIQSLFFPLGCYSGNISLLFLGPLISFWIILPALFVMSSHNTSGLTLLSTPSKGILPIS